MSDDRTCITNSLEHIPKSERPWPCVRRGQHFASCPSFGNSEDDTCRGCVPRSTERGFLCFTCWEKLIDSLGRLKAVITHLRSIDSDGQALGERVATSMEFSIIVPQSWFAADGLMDALGAPPIPTTADIDRTFELVDDALAGWTADTEATVNTREGAKRAVVLVRRLQTALHRWPDTEPEYRHVPFLLCPGGCGQRNLFRRAPLEYLDELLVECGTRDCGWFKPWDEFVAVYGVIFENIQKDNTRREKAERAKAKRAKERAA